MRQRFISIVTILAAAGSAAAQSTGSVEARYLGEGLGRNIKLSGSIVGTPQNFLIGQFRHEFRNGVGEGAFLTGEQATFCINLGQDAGGSWQTFEIRPVAAAPDPGPAMGILRAQAIADVWFAAAGQQYTSNNWAAAMQMILWDIVHDFDGVASSSVDVATGGVRFDSAAAYFPAVLANFNTLRSAIGNNTPIDGLRGMTHPTFQDQLVIIPTPGSLALAAIGITPLLRRRRR